MKHLVILFFTLLGSATYAQSYHQFGYIKEKGSKDQVGNRIEGVRIKIKGKNGAFQTNSRGEFTINGLERKFILERVERMGYELLDYETVGAKIEVSSEPLRITMVSKQQLRSEKEAILRELLKEFTKSQKENNQLQKDLSSLQKSFAEMADRLARIDYDLMTEKDKEIHICLEEGNFRKADSLILSKGTIQERVNYSQKGDKSIIDDCYILATNAVLRNDIDSALILLEQRTEIAPDNIECLLDAGMAYLNYQSNVQKALVLLKQALLFSEKKFGEDHPLTIKCNLYIATAHCMQSNFKVAIPLLHNCLGAFNVPNIPVVYERSEIDKLEEIPTDKNNIVSLEDSSLVSQLYGLATLIYSVQGNFNLAIKCKNQGELFSKDVESEAVLLVSTTAAFMMAGCYRQALDEIILPFLETIEGEPCNVIIAEFYSFAAMCYLNLSENDSTIIYSDKILNYFDSIKQQGNQYYHLALLVKSSALLALGQFDAAYDVLCKGERSFEQFGPPQPNMMAQIEGNKGLVLLNRGDITGAEGSLLKALTTIVELSQENNYDYRRIKAIFASNLAEIYKRTGRIEEAKESSRLAFAELKDLYKSIGYEHQDMMRILLQMAEIEMLSEDYLEAFRSYRMAYGIDNRMEYVKYINECFEIASKNKTFKKTRDFKSFKKEYQEFKETIETDESEEI